MDGSVVVLDVSRVEIRSTVVNVLPFLFVPRSTLADIYRVLAGICSPHIDQFHNEVIVIRASEDECASADCTTFKFSWPPFHLNSVSSHIVLRVGFRIFPSLPVTVDSESCTSIIIHSSSTYPRVYCSHCVTSGAYTYRVLVKVVFLAFLLHILLLVSSCRR